jgi:hypothetical protein
MDNAQWRLERDKLRVSLTFREPLNRRSLTVSPPRSTRTPQQVDELLASVCAFAGECGVWVSAGQIGQALREELIDHVVLNLAASRPRHRTTVLRHGGIVEPLLVQDAVVVQGQR